MAQKYKIFITYQYNSPFSSNLYIKKGKSNGQTPFGFAFWTS